MIKFKIEEVLENKDKSIYWLAEEADLSYPTVYNLVKNRTESIRFSTLSKIMKALEIEDFNKIMTLEN